MIGMSEVFLFLFVPVFVFMIVLWLWMLIDCLKRQDDNFAVGGNNAKLIWVLVIIFTGFIGALIYYFLIKRTDSSQDLLIGIALLASVVIVVILIASGVTETTASIEPYPSRIPESLTDEEIPGWKVPDNLTEEQVKIGSVSMVGSATENGKEISWNLPGSRYTSGTRTGQVLWR